FGDVLRKRVIAGVYAVFLNEFHRLHSVNTFNVDLDGQDLGGGEGRFHFRRQRVHALVAHVDGANKIQRGRGRDGFPHKKTARLRLGLRGGLSAGSSRKGQQKQTDCGNAEAAEHGALLIEQKTFLPQRTQRSTEELSHRGDWVIG